MTNKLQWYLDPKKYEHTTRKGKVKIVDSYSQWILTYGAKHDLTEEIEKEDSRDFNYVTVINKLGGDKENRPPKIRFKPFNFANSNQKTIKTRGDKPSSKFVGRLPVRTRSFQNKADDELIKQTYDCGGLSEKAKAKRVIIGIIDDAINIGHERFRTKDGNSRVDFAWIQDANKMEKPTVAFGCEWTNDEINQLIAQYPDDDHALMSALDLVGPANEPYRPSPLLLDTSHGTHVADLAAGYNSGDDRSENRRLITVQLPVFASQDTSGTSLMASIIAGIKFIYDRALLISKSCKTPIPVVINFSYGLNGGPRNGFHILERSLRAFALRYRNETATYIKKKKSKPVKKGAPFVPVFPVGNAHLTRTHARSFGQADFDIKTIELNVRLQPEDRTSSFLEIWFPKITSDIKLQIIEPDGSRKIIKFDTSLSSNQSMILAEYSTTDISKPNPERVVARVSLDVPSKVLAGLRTKDSPYWRVLLAFAPTRPSDLTYRAAPSGVWGVTASGLNMSQCSHIEAWLQRDESVSGLGLRGRQAYFDDDDYEDDRFDHQGDIAVADNPSTPSVITRNGTSSGISTNIKPNRSEPYESLNIVTIGGYRWDNRAAAVYSAAGYKEYNSPAFMSVSDTSRTLSGVLGAGTKTGYSVVQNGTSVAVPQVVRRLADILQKTKPKDYLGFDAVKVLSNSSEEPDRPTDTEVELANSPFIRKERVWKGLLPVHKDLADKVERHSERKSR
ncbi:MAG: hypothetical protein GY748_19570 [Planctomycetaceae bacterium]|nr:hypothetical protein [Planctomycetaceae bacterium]